MMPVQAAASSAAVFAVEQSSASERCVAEHIIQQSHIYKQKESKQSVPM